MFWSSRLTSYLISYPLAILDIEGEMEQELILFGLPNKCPWCKGYNHQVKAYLIVQKIKLGRPMPPSNLTLTNLRMMMIPTLNLFQCHPSYCSSYYLDILSIIWCLNLLLALSQPFSQSPNPSVSPFNFTYFTSNS
jgi:hypothetical protein